MAVYLNLSRPPVFGAVSGLLIKLGSNLIFLDADLNICRLVAAGGTDTALDGVRGSTGLGVAGAAGSSFIFLTAALIFQRGVTCEGGSIGAVAGGLLRGSKAIFLTRSTGVIDLLSSRSFSSS